MKQKARIAKIGKSREEIRQQTKAYFASLTDADLQRIRDGTATQKFVSEFTKMWDLRYKVMTEAERAEIDAVLKDVTS